MAATPFPASVTCSWLLSLSSRQVGHHHPGGCHLLPSLHHPHPGACHPLPRVSPLPGMPHTFPSACHPFPVCYPISSMSPPFRDGSPCSWRVSPLWVPAGLCWDTLLLMESPCLGKNTTAPSFTSMAQTGFAHQQQQKNSWRCIYLL